MIDSKIRMTPEDGAPLLTLDEAAAYLMMGRRTLERKIALGQIPVARAGGRGGRLRTLLWLDDVQHYWNQRRCQSYRGRTSTKKR